MTDEIKKNELNEEQLEEVSGGDGMTRGERTTNMPKFYNGQFVNYDDGAGRCGKAQIIDVKRIGCFLRICNTYNIWLLGENVRINDVPEDKLTSR